MKDFFELLDEIQMHRQWQGRSDSHTPKKQTSMQYTRSGNKHANSKPTKYNRSRTARGKTATDREWSTPTKGVRGVFNLRYNQGRTPNPLKMKDNQ